MQFILPGPHCYGHQAATSIDNLLKRGLSCITNCDLSEMQRPLASLPVKAGGLGVCTPRARTLRLFGFSGWYSTRSGLAAFSGQLLRRSTFLDEQVNVDHVFSSLDSTRTVTVVQTVVLGHASHHPDQTCANRKCYRHLQQVRLLAVTAPHSADWLHARTISACGLVCTTRNSG